MEFFSLGFWAFAAALQMPPAPPSGWERAGIVTILVVGFCVTGWAFLRKWVVPGYMYEAKDKECMELRTALDAEREQRLKDALDSKATLEATNRVLNDLAGRSGER